MKVSFCLFLCRLLPVTKYQSLRDERLTPDDSDSSRMNARIIKYDEVCSLMLTETLGTEE